MSGMGMGGSNAEREVGLGMGTIGGPSVGNIGGGPPGIGIGTGAGLGAGMRNIGVGVSAGMGSIGGGGLSGRLGAGAGAGTGPLPGIGGLPRETTGFYGNPYGGSSAGHVRARRASFGGMSGATPPDNGISDSLLGTGGAGLVGAGMAGKSCSSQHVEMYRNWTLHTQVVPRMVHMVQVWMRVQVLAQVDLG